MDRWTVEKAVKASNLDPPGRHIMLNLLTWADAKTAVIPDKFAPSLSVQAATTGLAKSTVADWLSRLDVAGWVRRDRPDPIKARAQHLTTGYRLTVPDGPHAADRKPPTEKEHAGCVLCRPPAPDPEGHDDQAGPPGGHGLSDEAGPGGGHGDGGLVRSADTAGSASRTPTVSATRTHNNLDHLNPGDRHWFSARPGDGLCRTCGAATSAGHPNAKEATS